MITPAEQFWDCILSEEPERIRTAYLGIDADSQRSVIKHLHDMATGEGWQPGQRSSALAALYALEELP